jgi:ribonuclease Z
LASEAKTPQKGDKKRFSKETGVPVEALSYSDFISEGRWNEVDEALRGVYSEASEALGRKFEYPGE